MAEKTASRSPVRINRSRVTILLLLVSALVASSVDSAVATAPTSPAGTTYTGIVDSDGPMRLAGSFVTIECKSAFMEMEVKQHGSSVTTAGPVIGLGFNQCNFPLQSISALGSFEIHTAGTTVNGNGTLTWTGGSFTFQTSVGICGFTTNATDIGTLTGSKTTGGTAVVDLKGTIPRTHGSAGFLCGSSATLTGTYTISSPDYFDID